jgi:hypothetical protein
MSFASRPRTDMRNTRKRLGKANLGGFNTPMKIGVAKNGINGQKKCHIME